MKNVTACKCFAVTYGTDYKAHVMVQINTIWKWDGLVREKVRISRDGTTIEITFKEFSRYFREGGTDELPEALNENE